MTNEVINIIARAIALEDGSYHWRDYLPMARAAFIAIREHDYAEQAPLQAKVAAIRASLDTLCDPAHHCGSPMSPVTNEGAGR